MTDIEQARTILTKWGEGVTPGPWTVSHNELRARDPWNGFLLGTWANREPDATLIVAMTDPALREVLDGMLADVIRFAPILGDATESSWVHHAERIAAVIIAIDQKMNAKDGGAGGG